MSTAEVQPLPSVAALAVTYLQKVRDAQRLGVRWSKGTGPSACQSPQPRSRVPGPHPHHDLGHSEGPQHLSLLLIPGLSCHSSAPKAHLGLTLVEVYKTLELGFMSSCLSPSTYPLLEGQQCVPASLLLLHTQHPEHTGMSRH